MEFRRRLQPRANVELVPMIDVVFQLVVFFMLTSTFVVTPGLELQLPRADTAEGITAEPIVLSIVAGEELEVYLNDRRYDSLESLDEALSQIAAARNAEQEQEGPLSLVVEGDRRVSYERMVRVLDVLRQNGFEAVSLKTSREEPDQ